jgi:SAM-dependent methyltransferase
MEQRATVFGGDAARYDRTRPGYPAELIDLLSPGASTRILDVGCGTGIASRLFAQRGCVVLGVEPDVRMAAVARERGSEVEVAPFEDWDADGRTFDIVVSAQAWHWVHPVAGATIARSVLSLGGTLAILWNVPGHDPAVQEAFDDIYDHFRLPDDSRCSPPGALAEGSERFIDGINTAGGFTKPVERTHTWSQSYTATEWTDLLPTHSDHRLLPPDELHDMLDAIATAIDNFGGSIEVTYAAYLVTADAV